MEAILDSKDLFEDVIVNDEPDFTKNKLEYDIWKKKNREAYSLIILSLSDDLTIIFRGDKRAKRIWYDIKKRFEGSLENKRIDLMLDLARLKLNPNENVNMYIVRAQKLAQEITQLGKTVTERELVRYIVEGLTPNFDTITAALSINREISLPDLRQTLLDFEKKRQDRSKNPENAFRSSGNQFKEKSCFICKRNGHFKKDCWFNLTTKEIKRIQQTKITWPVQGTTIKDQNKTKTQPEYALHVITREERPTTQDVWIIDSACTGHMTSHGDWIEHKTEERRSIQVAEEGRHIESTSSGLIQATVQGKDKLNNAVTLHNVLHVPHLKGNLMSIPSVVRRGNSVLLNSEGAYIYSSDDKLIGTGNFDGNMYTLNLSRLSEATHVPNEHCLISKDNSRTAWHRRLGHPSNNKLDLILKNNLLKGLDSINGTLDQCDACSLGKMTKVPYVHTDSNQESYPFEAIYVDLCGPMRINSLGGSKYFLTIVDGFSRRIFVEFLKDKLSAAEVLKKFIVKRENELSSKLKRLRTDNGTEFINKNLETFIESKGIKHELTTPYTPRSNGRVERANRTLLDKGRTLLADSQLPLHFWAEAVNRAAYLYNLTPTTNDPDTTPMEKWKGYSRCRRAYRVFNITTRVILETADIHFRENNNVISEEKQNDNNTDTDTYFFIQEDEQLDNHVLSDVDIEEPAPDTMINRQTESNLMTTFWATTNETIPKDYEEAIACEDKKHWENAMLEEIQNMYSHQVWELVPRPVNAKVVKSKWVFKISKDQENKTYKARLVAMGYNQIPGSDYNESFSPVIKNATLRTILSMAATKDSVIKLFDVKAAYLNGNIENTIFMEQPAGFVQDRNKVCKLIKSIYGLPQSGRSWYEKFSQVLHDCGLKKLKSDPCLFKWKNVTCKGMFLGIKIIQDKEGISLQQSHYVQQILQKYGMENCKEVPTPGSKEINLDNHIEDDNCEQHTYQEALGMLMFLAVNTRPDIAYITSKLSQYSRQPKQMHWTAIKRVMRYLRGTIDLGVKFERGKTGILKSYADASWSTTHDGKSYGGYVLKLGEATIDWKSSKQPLVALSTMEAEMIAACESCCQIKWIINLLRELEEWNFMEIPTAIYTDSQSLINWISSPKQSSRCRHINRKYHFLRDCYESRDICLLYKPSQDLEADIFTKDLSRDQMKKHLESLSIVCQAIREAIFLSVPIALGFSVLTDCAKPEDRMFEDCVNSPRVKPLVVVNADWTPPGQHPRRYNAPTANEVAVVLAGNQFGSRDIVLRQRDNLLQHVSDTHRFYDALQYPLIFWKGQEGYSFHIPQIDPNTRQPLSSKVSSMEFYGYFIMGRRNSPNFIVQLGQLFHQFLVNMYAKVESERLRYITLHQRNLRAESCIHLCDALSTDANINPNNLGQRIILQSSFVNSPSYLTAYTQGAFCYVRKFGRPDLFITFTSNPSWEELSAALLPGQKQLDRHDITARFFRQKLVKFIGAITKGQLYGSTVAWMYSVEWQKRGLPHAHILVWLANKLRPTQIDTVICAEFPDPIQDHYLILIRNLDPPRLCNGTRLCIPRMGTNVLQARILTDSFRGEEVLIPRIPIIPNDLPFKFRRLQFPFMVAFAMTINKSRVKHCK
ncbi:hypothetical protein LAZ67_1003719 [Cordylochernes scorpioides]|uniref:Retrovirus-related Pol polyprotein from transposon TNT 1-94 n=1 Tax=Cordylochernes scorpioides TaxID=51811 RepID=A0ABY6JX28_9ARAC|nr:hypothetical protein LAZ67_1003719 [Cordylochernes scorpioides]